MSSRGASSHPSAQAPAPTAGHFHGPRNPTIPAHLNGARTARVPRPGRSLSLSVEVSTMNLLRPLRRLFPAHRARRPQARPRVRLLLEALEDRAVPTAYTGVGPADG